MDKGRLGTVEEVKKVVEGREAISRTIPKQINEEGIHGRKG